MSQPFEFKLPSGNNVVTFRQPRNRDRLKVLGLLKENDPYTVDEVLASECLESINGRPILEMDPRRRMDPWALKDAQAYIFLFISMFTLNGDERKELEGKGRKLQGLDGEPFTESNLISEPEQS